MAWGRRRNVNEPTDTEKYFFNLGIRGNAGIQEISFMMMADKNSLEDAFPEYSTSNLKVNKNMNQTFYNFRSQLRRLVSMTEAALTRNSINAKENEIINECHKYLTMPYGSFDLRKLTDAAQGYYDMLVRKGIVPIVAGWEQPTTESKFNKF